MWELKSWVDPTKLTLKSLHCNCNAFDYLLEHHMDDINWKNLCYKATDDTLITIPDDCLDWNYVSNNQTITAIHRLKKNPSKICWYSLLSNPFAIDMIVENFDKIKKLNYTVLLSQNPKAVELLSNNIDKIDWFYLSTNPSAMELLHQYPEKINWTGLSINTNSSAVKMLLKNPEKIKWSNFCRNTNPMVIEYLKEHPERIVWSSLCVNTSAEELILQNLDKIDWISLSANPCIFEYNYKRCRTVYRTTCLKEEIMAKSLHPERICNYLKQGYTFDDF